MATVDVENRVRQETGCITIAGLDEAGRGALAGPVTAAAVVLPLDDLESLAHLAAVDDSKRLSPLARERLYELIVQRALEYGIGTVPAQVVDQHGVISATKQAMIAAIQQLGLRPEFLLIDGRIRLPHTNLPQQAIVRGDSISTSIAAASILAKVTRDRIMGDLDAIYPQYGFAQHKGYGTLGHRTALEQHGPCPEHRLSFAPLRLTLV